MKSRPILCLVVILAVCTTAGAKKADLTKLYKNKQYFDLRDSLRNDKTIGGSDRLFFEAVVANKFRQSSRSLSYLKRYLAKTRTASDSPWLLNSYQLLADNYLKTFHYRKAADSYEKVLKELGHTLTASDKEDYENSYRLWAALSSVPPQTITFHGPSLLKGSLQSVPLQINGHDLRLGIDSGADISIIINSLAQELELQIIEASIKVGSITGGSVNARLGVARELKLGQAVIHNAVFLVFEDKDLLGPSDGTVRGILGFPVISALREMTISSNEIRIPARPRSHGLGNLCLEGLKPLVAAFHNGQRLTFTFDTGANTSTLYPGFFRMFENEIKAAGEEKAEKVTGVAGSKMVPAYRVKDLPLTIGGREARYQEIAILTEYTLTDSRYFYGNLGQDLIKQFSSLTMNFESMSISFR